MNPNAAIPMNDPQGILFPHLRAITADLKTLFNTVTVSVPLATQKRLPQEMAWLRTEPFYQVLAYDDDPIAGDDFLALYETAARQCDPAQLLHLCYIDRIAFALQSSHRQAVLADISALPAGQPPIIFERSPAAWQTHPQNYYDIERMATTAGKWLFGRSLDFCWCHLVLPAAQLLEIIPTVQRRDMTHVAEYILPIRDIVQTRPVDWLAWEDPFILKRNAAQLKQEREQSPAETEKRLAYAIPMLQMFQEAADGSKEAIWQPRHP